MHKLDDFNDQTLGAFVDGQLDAETSESIINAMDFSNDIRQRVYELRRAKDLMRLAFSNTSLPAHKKSSTPQWRRYAMGIAVSLSAIAISLGSGISGYYMGTNNQIVTGTANSADIQKSERILLHISESNIEHFTAALDYAEYFLRENESSSKQIAVIANAGGLDFMRTGVSPYEEKIIEIMEKHSNIHLIACANSIRSLRKKGINLQLIKNVRVNKPAMDHIIEYVQDGWTYKKVNTLTKT